MGDMTVLKLDITERDARERLEALPRVLDAWYQTSRRVLPWREQPEPYRVWVSEIMLQQTRVQAVLPYFERFIRALPDVGSLARAEEDVLNKLWEGLGYYSRVRNMHAAAQIIMAEHQGVIPCEFEKLRALPGIGEYTAGAIASIAYQKRVPVVDGNVLRVLSRILASRGDILDGRVKKQYWRMLMEILPDQRPGDFNQAMMELGAMVCLPNGAPACAGCPARELCAARARSVEQELPVKAAKKPRPSQQMTVLVVVSGNGRVLLRKRAEKGLLAGLWEFPNLPGALDEAGVRAALAAMGLAPEQVAPCGTARHVFTHKRWDMTGYLVRVGQESPVAGCVWASRKELVGTYPVPSAFRAFHARALDEM